MNKEAIARLLVDEAIARIVMQHTLNSTIKIVPRASDSHDINHDVQLRSTLTPKSATSEPGMSSPSISCATSNINRDLIALLLVNEATSRLVRVQVPLPVSETKIRIAPLRSKPKRHQQQARQLENVKDAPQVEEVSRLPSHEIEQKRPGDGIDKVQVNLESRNNDVRYDEVASVQTVDAASLVGQSNVSATVAVRSDQSAFDRNEGSDTLLTKDALRSWPVWKAIKSTVRIGFTVFCFWLLAMGLLIGLFRFIDPPVSSLMVQHYMAGRSVDSEWRSFKDISPNLVRAVIVSEDWRFCQHYGIDLVEIEAAIARSRNGIPRGASTITMQVAKNLFLWPGKSYVRKALEVPLTLMMELLWSKRRILEVYLNIAEWGSGVFGAEKAARYHFKKPASKLSRRQSALLAVSLPNPIRRRAGRPGPGLRRLAGRIEGRMRRVGTGVSCLFQP